MTPGHNEDSSLLHNESFRRSLMRRQLRLSIGCAGAFMLLLVALPLANYLIPEPMSREVGGFTLSWLILGVLFFPFIWVISWFFIRASNRLEEDEVHLARQSKDPSP